MYIKFTVGFFEKKGNETPLWRSGVAVQTENDHPSTIFKAVLDACHALTHHQCWKLVNEALHNPEKWDVKPPVVFLGPQDQSIAEPDDHPLLQRSPTGLVASSPEGSGEDPTT